jgi:hypothetical protein
LFEVVTEVLNNYMSVMLATAEYRFRSIGHKHISVTGCCTVTELKKPSACNFLQELSKVLYRAVCTEQVTAAVALQAWTGEVSGLNYGQETAVLTGVLGLSTVVGGM